MRVLIANLKLFYQCRPLWLMCLLSVPLLLSFRAFDLQMRAIVLGAKLGRGTYFTGMGLVCGLGLAVGLIVARVQMEILSKPFAFCLPAHRAVSPKLILLSGLIVGLVLWLIWPTKDDLVSSSRVYVFAVGVTACFIGASAGFLLDSTATVLAVTIGVSLPLYGLLLDEYAPTGLSVTPASATITTILGTMSAMAVWLWLGRTDLFRRRCGRPWLSLLDVWSPAAWEKYRLARASTKARRVPPPSSDGFLLRLAMSSEDGSVAKYVWGTLYTWLLPGGGGRPHIVSMGLSGVAVAVLAWYMPMMGPIFISGLSLSSGEIFRNRPLNSPLLSAGGRRERFSATVVLIGVIGAIVTCCLVLTTLAMDPLGVPRLIGDTRPGRPEDYLDKMIRQPMTVSLVVLLAALFPIGRLLEIKLGEKRPGAKGLHVFLYFLVGMLAMNTRPFLMAIPSAYVALAFVLSWIACIYGVYQIAMRSDLGRK